MITIGVDFHKRTSTFQILNDDASRQDCFASLPGLPELNARAGAMTLKLRNFLPALDG